MQRDEFDELWDETPDPSRPEESTGIDYDVDLVSPRDDVDADPDRPPDDGGPPSDTAQTVADVDLDNVVVELVDLVNARDLEAVAELLAEDVEARFLDALSRSDAIEGLNDLLLRYPTLLLTRGDLGAEPVAAVWMIESEEERYDLVGYLTVEIDEAGDGFVTHVDYVDELPESDDLVVETPESGEYGEWNDWSAIDED